MRNVVRLILVLIVPLLVVGCSPKDGPTVHVTWSSPQRGLQEGTPVQYAGTAAGNAVAWVQVGSVSVAHSEGTGVRADIVLRKNMAHFVTMESAFLLRESAGTTNWFIEVQTLKTGGQPVIDGATFKATESSIELAMQRITVNWQTTILWALGGIAAIFIALLVVKTLFKGFAIVVSLAAGVAGAIYLKPYVTPYVLNVLPPDVPLDPFVYGAGFLAAYLATIIVWVMVRIPASALSGKGI